MYCSHIGLLYYPQTFQISPIVSFLRSQGPDVEMFMNLLILECSNFRHQSSLRYPSSQRAKNGRRVLPEKSDFHLTFSNLLHALNLRHERDGFTSPPKERVLRIFFALKNPTVSVGFEPANVGTKGQHATSRPPKPLMYDLIEG